MKKLKLLFLVIAMVMTLSLFGCGEPQSSDNPNPKPEPTPEVLPDPEPGTETVYIEHNGRTVEAEVFRPNSSKFSVVIFSHGYNGYRDDFKSSANFLMENGIGAITFTFCGSGARDTSGFATTDMTLVTEKEDLLAVMDYAKALKWFDGNLFLCGGSQGGMVSAMAGEERMNDIRGMALLFPGFCIPTDWNAWYPDDDKIPVTIPWWGVDLGRNFVLSLRDIDIYANMASFTKPVLLMHGTNDNIVPLSYSQRASETYPNAELVIYQGEGHGFSPATMTRVNDKLLDFIDNTLLNKEI
ncbi:MAG: alpha/beta hydrolase [Clostridia bacterium]|nr:alpha/beta hydrolase [Clostridia bacterium]